MTSGQAGVSDSHHHGGRRGNVAHPGAEPTSVPAPDHPDDGLRPARGVLVGLLLMAALISAVLMIVNWMTGAATAAVLYGALTLCCAGLAWLGVER